MKARLWRALSDIRGPKDLLVYGEGVVLHWRATPFYTSVPQRRMRS